MVFTVGKYYRLKKTAKCFKNVRPLSWNTRGCMDLMLDGKPHKCVAAGPAGTALFEGMQPNSGDGCWSWEEDDIESVPDYTEPEVKRYFIVAKAIAGENKEAAPFVKWVLYQGDVYEYSLEKNFWESLSGHPRLCVNDEVFSKLVESGHIITFKRSA